MNDKFKGATYAMSCTYVNFEDLTRADIINGRHLLLQLGRGGINVHKVHTLARAYEYYGLYWIEERVKEGYVIMNPKN